MAKHDAATRKQMSDSQRLRASLRTEEQKEATRLKQSDALVCSMWIPKGPRYGRQPGSKPKMDRNTQIGNTTLAKLERASIKRIMKDLATTNPDLFRDA